MGDGKLGLRALIARYAARADRFLNAWWFWTPFLLVWTVALANEAMLFGFAVDAHRSGFLGRALVFYVAALGVAGAIGWSWWRVRCMERVTFLIVKRELERRDP